jgi:hypothetical protein
MAERAIQADNQIDRGIGFRQPVRQIGSTAKIV